MDKSEQKRISSLETHIELLQKEIVDLKHLLEKKEKQVKELENKLAPFDR
jgi:predicted RNase H-like nuclease (RuvC/YqgF family)